MRDSATPDLLSEGVNIVINGYPIVAPPPGKPLKNQPELGDAWPNEDGGLSVQSLLIQEIQADFPPIELGNAYAKHLGPTGAGSPIIKPGGFDKLSSRQYTPPKGKIWIARTLGMRYVWRADIIQLNTAGGYSKTKTFTTGMSTSNTKATTFSRTIGVTDDFNMKTFFSDTSVKISAIFNQDRTSSVTTNITSSSQVTTEVTAAPNQAFIHWQLFEHYGVDGMWFMMDQSESPDVRQKYVDSFVKYVAGHYPSPSIETAATLHDGSGVFSATSYDV